MSTGSSAPAIRYGIVGANGISRTATSRIIQRAAAARFRARENRPDRAFPVLSQHLDELRKLGDDRVRQVISRYSRRTMLDGKEMTPGSCSNGARVHQR